MRKAQNNDCAIVTVSINTGKISGHAIAVLGTYSIANPNDYYKVQDFVILKNPWRSGDDIVEKLDIVEIENLIMPFKEIIKINKKHYETGVFYMPREYFEKWFRNILICKPNYETYFPEVYNCLNLYKEVAKYYKIKKIQYFFDITQGKNLIKVDIISKEKFESVKKIIQHNDSSTIYVYEKQTPLSIWFEGEYTDSSSDSVFIKDKNSAILTLKKNYEIKRNDFTERDIYSFNISKINLILKIYSVLTLNKIKSFEELNQHHLIRSYSRPLIFEDLWPNNQIFNNLMEEINRMNKHSEEIKEFLKEKYVYLDTQTVRNLNDGWVTITSGINLTTDEYYNDDGHYHVYFYGKNENSNLFDLIGQEFECSCYLLENNKIIKYCRKKFIFKKKVIFYNFTYCINGVKKTTPPNQCDYYNLEREKVQVVVNK